jgi:hypothetical protein
LFAQTASREPVGIVPSNAAGVHQRLSIFEKIKSCNPHEFGVNVGLAMSLKGSLIVGGRSFMGNAHEGHTTHEQIDQSTILVQDFGIKPEMVCADLGYRGVCKDKTQSRSNAGSKINNLRMNSAGCSSDARRLSQSSVISRRAPHTWPLLQGL